MEQILKLKPDFSSPVDFIPFESPHISSYYGPRILNGKPDFHDGIDFANKSHNCNDRLDPIGTDVYAICGGVICYDYDKYNDIFRFDPQHRIDSAGNMIVLDIIYNGLLFHVRYLHLVDNCVQNRQAVKKGERLGRYGDVGKSYGPHTHMDWSVSDWSQKIDFTPIMFNV